MVFQRQSQTLPLPAVKKFIWLGFCLGGIVSCQTQPQSAKSAAPGKPPEPASVLSTLAEVITLEAPATPSVQLVRRSGDPRPAVAAVIATTSSEDSLLLAELLRARFNADDWGSLQVQRSALGVALSREVTDGEGAKEFYQQVGDALLTPVDREFTKSLRQRFALQRKALKNHQALPQNIAACLGELSATEAAQGKPKQLSKKRLEKLRVDVAVPNRVAFSFVGPSKVVEQMQEAPPQFEDWPAPQEWSDPTPRRETWSSSQNQGPAFALAVRTNHATAAVEAAEKIGHPEHPLRQRLHSLRSDLEIEKVEAILRPSGACFAISIEKDPARADFTKEQAAQVMLALRQEMQLSLREADLQTASAQALMAPERALDASTIAAWSTLRAPGPERPYFFAATRGSAREVEDLNDRLNLAKKRLESQRIPVELSAEEGQGESWLLLGSPCGTRAESDAEAGLRALTMMSIARDFGGKDDVSLEPWIGPRSIGLLAHTPRRMSETAEQQALRLTRSLAAALAGKALDGRDVAAIRDNLIERIDSQPGKELIISLVGSGHIAALTPQGTERSLARLSTWDAERARAEFIAEPLRAVFVSNQSLAQGEIAAQALNDWLGPLRQAPRECERVQPEPVAPGVWHQETVSETVEPEVWIGIWTPAPAILGRATAWLLNRPGGYFENALAKTPGQSSAQAQWLGGSEFGGLFIKVRSSDAAAEEALAQVRGVLQRLSEGALTPQNLEIIRAEERRREFLLARSARGRIVEKYFSGSQVASVGLPKNEQAAGAEAPLPPGLVAPPRTVPTRRGFDRSCAKERHLIVKTTRRK
ncbi:MAG: hypothetical protein MK135_01745 [Polyangiaceae bacterium]|nr:hypothetical protein [Polyangiaceae bacterium]